MKFVRKYSGRIVAALLALIVIQSVALISMMVELEKLETVEPPAVSGDENEDAPQWLVSTPVENQQPEAGEETTPELEPESETVSAPAGVSAWDILANATVISHGMGAIGEVTTLNCLESFRMQYNRGVRVFEVDLRMTRDMQVVLRHDWRAGWQTEVSETSIPTLAEFKAKALLGKYTPLSFRDLLLLMEEYPDICVITDSKFTDAELVTLQFEAMLRDAQELGLGHVFDRIVVQVYNELMFKVVDNLGQFPCYIYTLYNSGFDQSTEGFEQIAAFCRDNGIGAVTMWNYWWREEFAPIADANELAVYVHTVNDISEAKALIESGVGAVYTDVIIPADLRCEEQKHIKPGLETDKGFVRVQTNTEGG